MNKYIAIVALPLCSESLLAARIVDSFFTVKFSAKTSGLFANQDACDGPYKERWNRVLEVL